MPRFFLENFVNPNIMKESDLYFSNDGISRLLEKDPKLNVDLVHRKINTALLSVISNVALMMLKLAAGFAIGSVAIISEGIHSGMDLLAALIALFSVKKSSQPADRGHPFGHGKVENISGTVEAALIFLAAAWIIYKAVYKLIHPAPLEILGWGIGVMLFSAMVNTVVSGLLFKIGKETDSVALLADAWHLRTDVYTSVGVMVSLILIWFGETVFKGIQFDWLDPVAAIAVALLIIKAAYHLTIESARDLMDVRLPEDEEYWIHELIRSHGKDVHGFHNLRTRKAGNFRFVEFHMKVDPEMTVEDSHRITEQIADAIEKRFPGTSVTIHTEPCDGVCEEKCIEGCLLPVKGNRSSKGR
jgi:cation diffusion facilitator family transporter